MLPPSTAPEKLSPFIFSALRRVSLPGRSPARRRGARPRPRTADSRALREDGSPPGGPEPRGPLGGTPRQPGGSGGPGPAPRTTTSDRPQARAAVAQHKDPFQGCAPLSRPSHSVCRPGSSSGPGGKVFTARNRAGVQTLHCRFSLRLCRERNICRRFGEGGKSGHNKQVGSTERLNTRHNGHDRLVQNNTLP